MEPFPLFIYLLYIYFFNIKSFTFSFQLQVFSFLSLTFLVSSWICTSIDEVSRPSSGNFPSSRLLYHTPTIFLEIIFQQRTSTPPPIQTRKKNIFFFSYNCHFKHTAHTSSDSQTFLHLSHFWPALLLVGSVTGLPVDLTPSVFSWS